MRADALAYSARCFHILKRRVRRKWRGCKHPNLLPGTIQGIGLREAVTCVRTGWEFDFLIFKKTCARFLVYFINFLGVLKTTLRYRDSLSQGKSFCKNMGDMKSPSTEFVFIPPCSLTLGGGTRRFGLSDSPLSPRDRGTDICGLRLQFAVSSWRHPDSPVGSSYSQYPLWALRDNGRLLTSGTCNPEHKDLNNRLPTWRKLNLCCHRNVLALTSFFLSSSVRSSTHTFCFWSFNFRRRQHGTF